MLMLRSARKAKGLTMKELGAMVGVSESAMSQYETGKREMDFETLLKIGEILDCSTDYLLRGEDKKRSLLTEVGEEAVDKGLIERLCILTPEELARVDAFVQGLLASREVDTSRQT